jgi:hypothetical protein
MGIKARQANIENLLMKDDEELGIDREELIIQQQELLFDLNAAQEKMKAGADVAKIMENLEASKKFIRESLRNEKDKSISYVPEQGEKPEEDVPLSEEEKDHPNFPVASKA